MQPFFFVFRTFHFTRIDDGRCEMIFLTHSSAFNQISSETSIQTMVRCILKNKQTLKRNRTSATEHFKNEQALEQRVET